MIEILSVKYRHTAAVNHAQELRKQRSGKMTTSTLLTTLLSPFWGGFPFLITKRCCALVIALTSGAPDQHIRLVSFSPKSCLNWLSWSDFKPEKVSFSEMMSLERQTRSRTRIDPTINTDTLLYASHIFAEPYRGLLCFTVNNSFNLIHWLYLFRGILFLAHRSPSVHYIIFHRTWSFLCFTRHFLPIMLFTPWKLWGITRSTTARVLLVLLRAGLEDPCVQFSPTKRVVALSFWLVHPEPHALRCWSTSRPSLLI